MRQWIRSTGIVAGLLTAGCATPQYMVRPTPVPNETQAAVRIEQAVSAQQAKDFDAQGALPMDPERTMGGVRIQEIVRRLVAVSERSYLPYRAYIYNDDEPNAAALADGRIYVSTGMLKYMNDRGGRADELAFVLAHEVAHTVAQHLVQRYEKLQQQQMVMAVVTAGAAIATRGASAGAQQVASRVVDVAGLLQDVKASGYSQQQELEADQLGIRYVIKAGFDPHAALEMLEDFERFDNPSPLMRTHPYISLRREYLARYLSETGGTVAATPPQAAAAVPASYMTPAPVRAAQLAPASSANQGRVAELKKVQQLYPQGSVSWNNLQKQIDALERPR